MTTEEWLAKALADAPPLTPPQLAALRPVCLRMSQHMATAPAAEAGAAAMTEPQEPERTAS